MHIPDGYLGPQTYLPLYGVFIATISLAVKKLKEKLTIKLVPFLGMASAFAFLIMMFNFPVPGGTSGHAVGATIIALILGPWAAIVSVSVALIIQALVFGDGGITALGANCVNMAVIMPLVGILVFKIIAGKSDKKLRLSTSAFIAGYISLNVSALVTGIEFGIQPLIATTSTGQALYSPFPLNIAVPAMALEHLVFFGFIEGLVTMLLFNYFYKTNKEIIQIIKT
jgi:cobalt/nickel transport system permease protein